MASVSRGRVRAVDRRQELVNASRQGYDNQRRTAYPRRPAAGIFALRLGRSAGGRRATVPRVSRKPRDAAYPHERQCARSTRFRSAIPRGAGAATPKTGGSRPVRAADRRSSPGRRGVGRSGGSKHQRRLERVAVSSAPRELPGARGAATEHRGTGDAKLLISSSALIRERRGETAAAPQAGSRSDRAHRPRVRRREQTLSSAEQPGESAADCRECYL